MKKQFFQMKMAVLETKNDDGSIRIQGFASTPDVDRHDEIVEPSAMKKAIKGFMANPVLLLQHDADKPIGVVERATASDDGLLIEAVVRHDTDGVLEKVKAGTLKGFSIGFIVKKSAFRNKETGEELTREEYYRLSYDEMEGYRRVIKELELVEISVVSIPSNPKTLFTLAKSLKSFSLEEKKELEADAEPEQEVEEVEQLDEEEVEEPTEENEEVSEEMEKLVETEGEAPEEDEEEEAEEVSEEPETLSTEAEAPDDEEEAGEIPADETTEGKSITTSHDTKALIEAKDAEIHSLRDQLGALVTFTKELQERIASLSEQPMHKGVSLGAGSNEPAKTQLGQFLEKTLKNY